MILAGSHFLVTSDDVPALMRFLGALFEIEPRFENPEFGEFVTRGGFRIAVFKVVGKTAEFFDSGGARGTVVLGVTVEDVDGTFARADALCRTSGARHSGPPKAHPWGEKSFLLIDPQGNRWEIAESPSASGMLVDR